jgi:hypothetical protein
MLLFRDSVASIVKWMQDCTRMDAELAYWLEKYLLFRGTRSLTALIMAGGGGLLQLRLDESNVFPPNANVALPVDLL